MRFKIHILAIGSAVIIASNCCGLTSGPTQPEFSSFEPVDVTDMVNLPTGGFTYTVPLGEVKGPAGVGYPIVLNYHAGIRNEQEATWTGLGWDVNVGAVNRQVVGFPDDISYGLTSAYFWNPGESYYQYGLSIGWGGFNVNFGWNNKGFQGITGIGVGMDIGPVTAGVSINTKTGQASGNVGIGGVGVSVSGQGVGISAGSNGASVGLSFSHKGTALSAGYSNSGVNLNGSVAFGSHQAPSYSGSVGLSTPLGGFNLSSKGMSISAGGASFSSGQSFNFTKAGLSTHSLSGGFGLPLPYGITLGFTYAEQSWHYSQLAVNGTYGYLYGSVGLQQEVDTYNPVVAGSMGLTGTNSLSAWNYFSSAAGLSTGTTGQTISPTASTNVKGMSPLPAWTAKIETSKMDDFSLPSQDNYSVASQGLSGNFKPFSYNSRQSIYCPGNNYDGDYLQIIDAKDPSNYTKALNTNPMKISPEFSDGMTFKMLNEANYNLIDDPTGTGYTDAT
jgi:hypothetical protein